MKDIKGLEIEQERKSENLQNPDIDSSLSHLNYDLVEDERNLYHRVKDRVDEVRENSRVQKNSVVSCSNIFTSPEGYPQEEQERYLKLCYFAMCNLVGKENVVSAKIHLDEERPHMHLHFVPITEGKLSCRNLVTRKWLNEIHNKVPEVLRIYGFDVQRGDGKTSRRGNIKDIHTFKAVMNEDILKEREAIQKELERTKAYHEDEVEAYLETVKEAIRVSDDLRESQNKLEICVSELERKEETLKELKTEISALEATKQTWQEPKENPLAQNADHTQKTLNTISDYFKTVLEIQRFSSTVDEFTEGFNKEVEALEFKKGLLESEPTVKITETFRDEILKALEYLRQFTNHFLKDIEKSGWSYNKTKNPISYPELFKNAMELTIRTQETLIKDNTTLSKLPDVNKEKAQGYDRLLEEKNRLQSELEKSEEKYKQNFKRNFEIFEENTKMRLKAAEDSGYQRGFNNGVERARSLAIHYGLNFFLVNPSEVKNIQLKKTDYEVKVDGLVFPLYSGKTHEEAYKIWEYSNANKVKMLKINDHLIQSKLPEDYYQEHNKDDYELDYLPIL